MDNNITPACQSAGGSDLTFITNEKNKRLLDRFKVLIKDTRLFDVLVGYFYTSGFHALYKSLESTDKIRILIGISTNKEVIKLIQESKIRTQPTFQFSHAEVKQEFENSVAEEMEQSEDNATVEEGISKFIEWLKNDKLEIRAYPTENIHAKLYLMTFKEGDRDIGRVITGSSNFTQAGLIDNLEFNVELKTRADYDFALQKFNELWRDAADVKDRYIETIQTKTWLNQNITPYELYLKFLYEYFKDELSLTSEIFIKYLPQDFKRFEYQEQAVLNAKKTLEEYGGVFISDVVGLGKTYIATMLAGQLDGRTLVIAPPSLLNKNNPGSWPNIFSDFHIPADFESIGKLEAILNRGVEKYANVIIDEAHRFRTETTLSYEKLAQICRGKRVILVTATPYNNTPKDILNQIKLFQNPRKSTIPNLSDLERFFNRLDKKLKKIDKQKDYDEYLKTVKENAKEIREKVLKYLMVRRTRNEIEKYFSKDIKKQKLKFPEVRDPISFYYQLNEDEDKIFNETIHLITQKFKYARYTPLLYYKGKITQPEEVSQKNMGKFMKILLVKRLESSFYAFRNSIDRFIRSYDMFLKEFDNGNVFVSKKYINKIFEVLENDDDDAVQRLIDEGKAERYVSSDFTDEFKEDLKNDLEILRRIKSLWEGVRRDPKLQKLQKELSKNKILKNEKLIIFTESKETAEYLTEKIRDKALCYHGSSSEAIRDKVIDNFDARARTPKDDYMILISTEVLSEGVNLHRSNIVINYDIPWNPTRMMQRVGRINRIDTKFNKIYTFNFFPTIQSEDEIQLQKTAESKINAFLTLLGGDAAILTEGEPVSSHELFNRLISKETISGEEEVEESELKYLNIIKDIRDKNPQLFEKVKRLPKKARSAKEDKEAIDSLLTYFRLGKLQKFFITNKNQEPREVDFITTARVFECSLDEKRRSLSKDFYELLDRNKKAFIDATTEEYLISEHRRGRDSGAQVLKTLKATLKVTQRFTDEQEDYLKKVIRQLEEGAIPKQTTKKTLKALNSLKSDLTNPLKVLAIVQHNIPERLLESHYVEYSHRFSGKREVILSLYLIGKNNE
ncbi:phospholipase D-like domain-containing protein [Dehalococcoidia bacterium]|nr:phospholipase D-like domain-containing protein [Dehalococcoidia bacterium]